LDLFTLRHSVCYFFCSGSLAIDPVDGTLNYVIALLLSPIGGVGGDKQVRRGRVEGSLFSRRRGRGYTPFSAGEKEKLDI
jgi:hypothetical protein